MKRAAAMALAGLLLCNLVAGVALAASDDVANDVAGEVMSPFCPGVTLENCPSDAAVALRARIAAWAERGWSKQRIVDELVAEYGATIRAVPPASGSGLWAWIAPALALLAGAAAAGFIARRWSRHPRPSAPVGAAVSPEIRARLDDELRTLRGET